MQSNSKKSELRFSSHDGDVRAELYCISNSFRNMDTGLCLSQLNQCVSSHEISDGCYFHSLFQTINSSSSTVSSPYIPLVQVVSQQWLLHLQVPHAIPGLPSLSGCDHASHCQH